MNNVVIVSHVYVTGPSQKLRDYLVTRVENLLFIGHPFSYCEDTSSFFIKYRQGRIVEQKKIYPFRLPGILMFFKDALLTFIWVSSSREKYDLYFGVDNLNAFVGLLLKKFKRVKRVIFYTIDFIPQRFPNKILNWIYHQIDNICVRQSDWVWNLSSVMVGEREKKGVSPRYRTKQIEVPVGTDLDVEICHFSEIERYTVVFMGHLREGQGLEFLIDCVPEIIRKVPKARLLLIGGGPLEDELRKQVKQKGLGDKIEITGFVKDFEDINERLTKCAVAVAPYEESAYTRYTDPGKLKAYLACNLPVVVTKVPRAAYEIEKARCGFAVRCNKKELVDAVAKLLTNEELLKIYRKNALNFARKYSWDKIFARAFAESL